MSDLLDIDFRDDKAAYDAWVDRADEWVPAIQQWAVQTQGHETNVHWIHHILWRFFRETERWHTLRNAMEDREPGSSVPAVPPPTTNPTPSQPGRRATIAGPFHPRKYSYWSDVVVARGKTFAFAGRNQRPVFFDVRGEQATEIGQLVPFLGETEGWYWDTNGWLYIIDGNKLLHVNPFTLEQRTAFEVDSRYVLWQPHSSDDGHVHSATIKDANTWQKVGTVAWYRGELKTFMAIGSLDESIVTKCGEWLIIQEDRYNRIIRLRDRWERTLSQEDGAVGHCDTGHGFVVGEDDAHGACVKWDLVNLQRYELWKTWNMGHVSVRGDRVLASNAESLTISLYDLSNGSNQQLLHHGVRPVGTPSEQYDMQVRAALSPCATRFAYMTHGNLHVVEI